MTEFVLDAETNHADRKSNLAITCSVYGAMVHTVFCDAENSISVFEAMKRDLADFTDRTTTWSEECDFYDYFTSK